MKVIPNAQHSDRLAQNSHETSRYILNSNTCPNCYKQYSRNWCLLRHVEKCKGDKNKFRCEHCFTDFKHEKSRFYHYKRCSVKNKVEAPSQPTTTSNTINTQTYINNQHNNTNNNIIIVYNSQGNSEFRTDHLKAEDLQKIIKLAAEHIDRSVKINKNNIMMITFRSRKEVLYITFLHRCQRVSVKKIDYFLELTLY